MQVLNCSPSGMKLVRLVAIEKPAHRFISPWKHFNQHHVFVGNSFSSSVFEMMLIHINNG